MFSSFELLVKFSNLRNIIISSRGRLVRNELSVGRRGTMEFTAAFVSSPPVFCVLFLLVQFLSQGSVSY
jgi:hypothetical protein